MSEENKALVRRVVDAFNSGDLAAIDRYFAPDYVDHERAAMGFPPGPEGVKQAWGMLRAAIPDLQGVIEQMIAEGDRVMVRGTFRGTHQGEFMGIPATGRPVTVSLIDINRIADGRLVERWAVTDMLGLLQQIGAIPAGAAA